MAEQGERRNYSMLQSAMEELLEGTRAVAHLAGKVGGEAVGAIPDPLAVPVARMLDSLRQLSELAPPVLPEFDILVEELHAQRLAVQALQAELSAFDHQMEVIENALTPLRSWTHQWSRLRQSLTAQLAGPPKPDAPEH